MTQLPDGIRQRGDSGTYMVDYTDQSGKRHRPTCKTVEQAVARLAQIKASDTEAGVDETGQCRTLADAYALASTRWDRERSGDTMKATGRAALTHFGPAHPLLSIDAVSIRGYRDALIAGGNADGTVNRKLSALSVMLKEAVEVGALNTLPTIKKLRERNTRIRFLDPKEEALLTAQLRQLGADDAADLTEFLIDTGLRVRQEGLAACRSHLERRGDGRMALLVPDGKGGKPRTIILTQRAERIALAWAERARAEGRENLYPLAYDVTFRVYRRACTLLRYDDVNIHTLRHTCASRMAQRGVSLAVIMQWMGHGHIATTMRYAHLATEHLMSAVDAMEQAR